MLGDYAGEVLGAYALSLGAIALIVVLSWRQARAAARQLRRAEGRHGQD